MTDHDAITVIGDESHEQPQIHAHWFVFHVHSGREQRIAHQLAEKAIRCEVPMTRQRFRSSRHAKGRMRTVPLLPGYAFICFERPVHTSFSLKWFPWGIVMAIEGVIGVLGANNTPQQISGLAVQRTLSQAEGSTACAGNDDHPTFKPGQTVAINSDIWSGYRGRVIDASQTKVTVLAELFNGCVPVVGKPKDFIPF